jgi:ubiquinone/menaquinone biosynthesis C-methylase UbiE
MGNVRIIRPSYSSYGPVENKGMLLYYYSSNSIVRYYFWNRLRSLLNLAKFRPEDTVLEIGFGPGIIFPSLADVSNLIIGIDPLLQWIPCSPSSCFRIVKKMCKSEGIEGKVELVRGDAQNIPLQQEICDVVIATDVLEHVPDLSRSMREIERILKRDGTFLACIPMENFYRRNARRLFNLPGLSTDEHFYKEILGAIESVFRITKMQPYPRILPISVLVSARRKN